MPASAQPQPLGNLTPGVLGYGDGLSLLGWSANQLVYTTGTYSQGGRLWRQALDMSPPEGVALCPAECYAYLSTLSATEGRFLVQSVDLSYDKGLFWTDGTQAGTWALADPDGRLVTAASWCTGGPDKECYGPFLATTGLHVVFYGQVKEEFGFWSTDGTIGGTHLLLATEQDEPNAPIALVAVNDRVVLLRREGWPGRVGLWSLDPETAEATLEVEVPGQDALWVEVYGSSGAHFFFETRSSGTPEAQIWASDGTIAGTVPVMSYSSDETYVDWLASAHGLAIFRTWSDTSPDAIWRTDGTQAGTGVVHFLSESESLPDSYWWAPRASISSSGSSYFYLSSGDLAPTLLRIKRTQSSAEPVLASCPTPCTAEPALGVWSIGSTILALQRVEDGVDLVAFLADAPATTNLGRLCEAPCTARIDEIVEAPLGWIVAGRDDDLARLWSFGAEGGAILLRSLPTGEFRLDPSSAPRPATAFLEHHYDSTASLGVTDGTPDGTRILTIGPQDGSASRFDSESALPESLLVAVSGDYGAGASGRELWAVDRATSAVTSLGSLGDSYPSGLPAPLLPGSIALFESEWAGSEQITRSDGTAPGTFRITHFEWPEGVRTPPILFGQHAYFWAAQEPGSESLWRTDGNTTEPCLDCAHVPGFPAGLSATEDHLFLLQYLGIDEWDLWSLAQDLSSRRLVVREPHGIIDLWGSKPYGAFGGRLLFAQTRVDEDSLTTQLKISNGSAGGTQTLLASVDSATNWSRLDTHTLDEALLILTIGTTAELWRSDGTPAGTTVLLSGIEYGNYPDPAPYLMGDSGVGVLVVETKSGDRLWLTDGTPSGTAEFGLPVSTSVAPSEYAYAGGRLYFSGWDVLGGREVWQSDGTPAGTFRSSDLAPASLSSHPQGLRVTGDTLLFVADDGLQGSEPWALRTDAPLAPCRSTRFQICLDDGGVALRASEGSHGTQHPLEAGAWGSSESGWFGAPRSGFDPTIHVGVGWGVKVLDARAISGNSWLFATSMSTSPAALDLFDFETRLTTRYSKAKTDLTSFADFQFGTRVSGLTSIAPSGSQRATYPSSSPKVAPSSSTCIPTSTVLCLREGRFAVEVAWKDFLGSKGFGRTLSLLDRVGAFWFFGPEAVDLFVEIEENLVSETFSLRLGGLSNVAFDLSVRDLVGGSSFEFVNPLGEFSALRALDQF